MKRQLEHILPLAVCVLATALYRPGYSAADTVMDTVIVEALAQTSPGSSTHDASDVITAVPYTDGADYLRSLPGVAAGRFGGHGLEPVIRGQAEGRLNVASDNVYTFGGCPNRMDPPTAYINLQANDEITVVRGYQSVLNGFGGSGGSIIVEQNPPNFEENASPQGSVQSGYDSNSEMFHFGGNLSAGTNRLYLKSYGSYKDAKNYEDGKGDEVRSSFEETSGGISFGYTPENTHVNFGGDFHRIDDALFPGAGMDSPLSETRTFKAGLEHDLNGPVWQNINVSGYASLADHEMDNFSLRAFTSPFARRVQSESDTYGAKLESAMNVADRLIDTALEWRRNNRNADRFQGTSVSNVDTLQSLMWPDITIDEIGLAAETDYVLGEDTVLVAGGRYDLVHVDYGRANEAAPAAGGRTPNDVYSQFYGMNASSETEHNVGGVLRLEHDYRSNVMVHAGISRSVRTADATERGLANFSGAGGALSWVGNPDIDPEKHHQLDIGISLDNQSWTLSSSLYANYVNDYILRDSARSQADILVDFPNADVYRNIDALLAGWEWHGKWQIAPQWFLEGDATYTFGEDLDADRALPQIPPLQGKLELMWQVLDNFRFGPTMGWAIKQNRVDIDPLTGTGRDVGETSGYAVFDLAATWDIHESAVLNFGVTNMFDKTYSSHLNRSNISDPTEVRVNEPGRSFYVQYSMSF